ncbi:AAA family ATPase [Streptomyces sp. NBC_01465]|uniref:AAA family ATPase n=1 Tax=Streptomyces sp. NBC_01465 TaxID=2903878 RepID=UPI002E3687F9|nr:ATP-binding protein [Streptomyces sp. NBC_01465]
MDVTCALPTVTELRLAAFRTHRGAVFPLAPVTLFAGAGGSGKSTVLQAYEALARLGAGDTLAEAFPDPAGCVPEGAEPDTQGRRGFRIGCTVQGPAGSVRLDLAVQAEPELRIAGERLSCGGQMLLTTALRDPGRSTVQAAWHTAGAAPVTRAPLPDDLLGTALLPLRVAGKTEGQLQVLAAAEQTVVALRSVYVCDPQPQRMRGRVTVGTGRLENGCDNLAAVVLRTQSECAIRFRELVAAARAGCAGPVETLLAEELADGTVRAVLGRGGERETPLERLGDGELRYLALALVLLTGDRVLAMDPAHEVPEALQSLTFLLDGFDRCLDARQSRELLELAARTCARDNRRLVGAVGDASAAAAYARETAGVTVVDLSRD